MPLCLMWRIDGNWKTLRYPENSVVILTCDGVLYSWETYRLEQFIAKALANPKIAGIVLFVNGLAE